jgi:hypothetical protein
MSRDLVSPSLLLTLEQKYYSIQAKGKRLEDSLTAEEFKDLKEYFLCGRNSFDKANIHREHGDLIEAGENRSGVAVTNSDAGQSHAEGASGAPTGQHAAQTEVCFQVNGGTSAEQQLTLIGTCDFRTAGRVKHSRVTSHTAGNSRNRCVPGLSTFLQRRLKGLVNGENHSNFFTVQDENLKNMMMSWYYAGYYTGLYEGQQKKT